MTPSRYRAGRSNKRLDLWPLSGLVVLFISGVVAVAVIALLLDIFVTWWVG